MAYDLKEMAELVAFADRRSPKSVHLQIRNPNVRALLNPIERPGRPATSAHKYGEKELARVRVFMALIDFGLDHRTLELVNRTLCGTFHPPHDGKGVVHPEWARVPGGAGWTYGDNLEALISAARAGDDVHLRVRYARDVNGERSIRTSVLSEPQFGEGRASRAIDLEPGSTYIGEIRIPAAALIRSVLED